MDLEFGMDHYLSENRIPYETTWYWTPFDRVLPSIGMPTFIPADYEGFEKNICKQLANNLPVIMQIGLTSEDMFFYDERELNKYDTGIIDQFQFARVQKYVTDENGKEVKDKDGNSLTEDYDISKHYMTIDKYIVDDVANSKWIQVETWGEYYYISFDEWMNSETGMFLAGGILGIEEVTND